MGTTNGLSEKNCNRSARTDFIIGATLSVCFVLYTVLICTFDKRPVGALNVEVGFSDLNEAIYNAIGYNDAMYKVSEIMGYFALLLVGIFGLMGLIQLVKRKSLMKVDTALYVLAGGYAVMLVLYVFFDKFLINYRPFIVGDETELESSYPSSHTFLAIFVCLSAFVMYSYYIKAKNLRLIAQICTLILMVLVIITRLLSGAHWLTDIVGSLLLGSALFSFFVGMLNKLVASKTE